MDGIYPTESQWCNDGVAAASRDGGPAGKGAPDSFRVLNVFVVNID